jgi:hypothetical protein
MDPSTQIIDDAIASHRALPGALLPLLRAIRSRTRWVHDRRPCRDRVLAWYSKAPPARVVRWRESMA